MKNIQKVISEDMRRVRTMDQIMAEEYEGVVMWAWMRSANRVSEMVSL